MGVGSEGYKLKICNLISIRQFDRYFLIFFLNIFNRNVIKEVSYVHLNKGTPSKVVIWYKNQNETGKIGRSQDYRYLPENLQKFFGYKRSENMLNHVSWERIEIQAWLNPHFN